MEDKKSIMISSGLSDSIIDLNDYTIDTSNINSSITLDSSLYNNSFISTGTSGASYSWVQPYTDYSITGTSSPNIQINTDGITMKPEADLKIGDRSLKDFMDRVEDRLAILHPNEALEDKWEQLKELRRQYEALEKDILEKEKIMKILKEQ
jgi:hypothetical protein